jgi:alpha-L-rhamnosidase
LTSESAANRAVSLSRCAVATKDAWRDLVLHVDVPFVEPVSIQVEGDAVGITNPNGMISEGTGSTTVRTSGWHATSAIVDLGRVAMGYVEIGVLRTEGAPMRVSYAQFRQFLGPYGDGMRAPFGTDAHPFSRVDVFESGSGATVLVSPGKREMRYIAITLDGPGSVDIDFVRVRQTIYPVRYDGHFVSSDELLNSAWYSSAYTGDLATLSEESSLPGAPAGPSPWMLTVTFDRVLFMGDLHMQALAGYFQSSDYYWLVRNTLRQFGCIQQPDGSFPSASSHLVNCDPTDPGPPDGWRWPDDGPHPDRAVGLAPGKSIVRDMTIDSFTAFWVAALADYYLYSADAKSVRPLLPVARRAIAFLCKRTTADGLFYEPEDQRSNPDADVPWVANWEPGDIATGVDSYSNAVFYGALKGLAFLELNVAERSSAARRLERHAERVRQALLKHLWDPQAGAMILNSEDPLRDHTGDANAGNLMFKTLDDERGQAAMKFLRRSLSTPFGTRVSEYENNPYRGSAGSERAIFPLLHAVEALGRVRYGDGRGAVDLIRRSWGHMLSNGPGTGWFTCSLNGTPGSRFANNSWVTAIPALSEGILGFRPLAPGYRRWEIAPQTADLEWAQGSAPTPSGAISSRWVRTEDGLTLSVEAPEECEGVVVVPSLHRDQSIAMDGHLVWRDGGPVGDVDARPRGAGVAFRQIRGSHTFACVSQR